MKRHINARHLMALILWTISAILLVMTPYLNYLANLARDINGYGGECLLWLFPLMLSGMFID